MAKSGPAPVTPAKSLPAQVVAPLTSPAMAAPVVVMLPTGAENAVPPVNANELPVVRVIAPKFRVNAPVRLMPLALGLTVTVERAPELPRFCAVVPVICRIPPLPKVPLAVPRTRGMLVAVMPEKNAAPAVAPSSTSVPALTVRNPAPVVKALGLAFCSVTVPSPCLFRPPVVAPEIAPEMMREVPLGVLKTGVLAAVTTKARPVKVNGEVVPGCS